MKLRQARLTARLSQASLGELVGVSRSAITQWETGRCGPQRDLLVPLADALGLTLRELLQDASRSDPAHINIGFDADLIRQAWQAGIDVRGNLNAFLHTLVHTSRSGRQRQEDRATVPDADGFIAR